MGDFLGALTHDFKKKSFTFRFCIRILHVIQQTQFLLNSNENHILICLNYIILILETFSDLIRDTIQMESKSMAGISLAAEERYHFHFLFVIKIWIL